MDWTVKYGGRGFCFEVYVNTDEDPKVILDRLRVAAGGPALNATVIVCKKIAPGAMTGLMGVGVQMDVADDALTRIGECVLKLDAAWNDGDGCYEVTLDPYAVRYAHLLLGALPSFAQGILGVSDIVRKFDESWKPDDPKVARAGQAGRYDDALDDADVRRVHLAMATVEKKGRIG